MWKRRGNPKSEIRNPNKSRRKKNQRSNEVVERRRSSSLVSSFAFSSFGFFSDFGFGCFEKRGTGVSPVSSSPEKHGRDARATGFSKHPFRISDFRGALMVLLLASSA